LPKGTLDITFPFKCQHQESLQAKSKIKHAKSPLGFGTRFAPHQFVQGIASIALAPNEKRIIGYVPFYEVDYGLLHAHEHYRGAAALAKLVAERTGSSLLIRSEKGWHTPSLSIVPYQVFKNLAKECESIIPSDHRYLVLRISKKSNEHLMKRLYQCYEDFNSTYPISLWHKRMWELALGIKIPTYTREIETGGLIVRYIAWS